MSNYWQDRMAKAQNKLSDKNLKQIQKQLKKYYGKAAERVIRDFEATYDKLLATVGEGKQPTPADLYKLNKYWEAQAQLRGQLNKLGERTISTLTKVFEINFLDIYYSINIDGHEAFNTIDSKIVNQLINQIWVADGKSFSQRVWDDVDKLVDTLNDELLHCVITGKKTTELVHLLQERFGVSYNNADMIARTEMAHIQTEAAKKRYEDYGIKQVQIWASPDERRCKVCGKLHKTKYFTNEQVPIPVHPRCRCCIIPVVE